VSVDDSIMPPVALTHLCEMRFEFSLGILDEARVQTRFGRRATNVRAPRRGTVEHRPSAASDSHIPRFEHIECGNGDVQQTMYLRRYDVSIDSGDLLFAPVIR
jgi:hypothetical protein